ncbi:hypothetical protein [uncultured Shewanella sp.]|uniref:hypothetical protein n=1 Tax=uncultured Shewanella sp. TaxID=173975 RepID=UPI002627168E|nr:hypothetical protein [uncultured Shewanella sp.]
MSAITPLYANIDPQQINRIQSSPSDAEAKQASTQSTGNSTVDQIKTDATMNPSITEADLIANEKFMAKWWEFQQKEKSSAADLLSETQQVLDDIAKENPSLLDKAFDFTYKNNEIEIVDHNLSKEEYHYLKAKLNANEKLVEATDFLNLSAARENTLKKNDGKVYTKEDIEGRIHVLDIIEKAQKRTADFEAFLDPNIIAKPYDKRAMFHKEVHLNALDILKNTSVSFKLTV